MNILRYAILSLFFFQFLTQSQPISAPPTWAKWAILSPLICLIPKYKEPIIKMGNKIFALMGKGININISSAFGKRVAKAAIIPKIAPEAPTIGTLR